MNQKLATITVLLLAATVLLGCGQPQDANRFAGGGSVSWNSQDEGSIDGVDSALVEKIQYKLEDGGEFSVLLWTDFRTGAGIKKENFEEEGQDIVHQGYVYWDKDETTRCPFKIRLRNNGQHTVELLGSEYDLKDGSTILVKNRGGEISASVKHISGIDLENANKFAHKNQEIIDFYSDNEQNATSIIKPQEN